MAEDGTYQPKVYREQGGNRWVIKDGGSVIWPVRAITADVTLTAEEAGLTVLANAADLTVTLPAASQVGMKFTVSLTGAGLSAGTGLTITPASGDSINGGGLTSVADESLILAGAGDAEGDTVTLVSDGGTNWYITSIVGTWSKG